MKRDLASIPQIKTDLADMKTDLADMKTDLLMIRVHAVKVSEFHYSRLCLLLIC